MKLIKDFILIGNNMETPKLKLVYHLYIPDGEIPEIYKYHFTCLKEFANVFDEYDITFSVSDINNEKLIRTWEERFFNIGIYKNVTFNVVQNNIDYREGETLKTRVFDKMPAEKSIVFFAHSKGATNSLNDSTIDWVLSMYYFNLHDIEELKNRLIRVNRQILCGHFAYYSERLTCTKYRWQYPGSFYWINVPALYEESLQRPLPVMHNRFYAEDFPGNYLPLKTSSIVQQRAKGMSEFFFDDFRDYEDPENDFYANYRHIISYLYLPEDLNNFFNFVDYIKENLIEFK